jgi:uncharacterized radical SAM superfamily Fe-S cluster-containing enzyme
MGWFGLTTILLRRRDPIIGSLILTDRCNLACQHCAVANIRRVDYPFPKVRADLQALHDQGVRVVLLYGGEPFLWHDGDLRLADVVAEARRIGFPVVSVVTNGTRGLDLPEADLIWSVSTAPASTTTPSVDTPTTGSWLPSRRPRAGTCACTWPSTT